MHKNILFLFAKTNKTNLQTSAAESSRSNTKPDGYFVFSKNYFLQWRILLQQTVAKVI